MILADKKIAELIERRELVVEPEFNLENIRPAGIRFHLGDEILIPVSGQTVDITNKKDLKFDHIELSDEGYILKPGQFLLGTTYERIQTPRNVVATLDGRSTVARIGLSLHCTSSVIDGNFEKPNAITLEINNVGNFKVVLKRRMPVGMFVFHQLTGEIEQEVQTQYKSQSTVTAPNLKTQFK